MKAILKNSFVQAAWQFVQKVWYAFKMFVRIMGNYLDGQYCSVNAIVIMLYSALGAFATWAVAGMWFYRYGEGPRLSEGMYILPFGEMWSWVDSVLAPFSALQIAGITLVCLCVFAFLFAPAFRWICFSVSQAFTMRHDREGYLKAQRQYAETMMTAFGRMTGYYMAWVVKVALGTFVAWVVWSVLS